MQYFGYLRRNPNSAPDTDYTGYDLVDEAEQLQRQLYRRRNGKGVPFVI